MMTTSTSLAGIRNPDTFQPPQRPNLHSPNQRRLASLPVRFGGTATGHSWSPPRISSVYQLHQYINTSTAVNLRAATVRTIPTNGGRLPQGNHRLDFTYNSPNVTTCTCAPVIHIANGFTAPSLAATTLMVKYTNGSATLTTAPTP